ncbi:helix-turn-helix domain-containing protein [Corynebacterium riegelii]|uniref:helix-turn-helix domain-containing protein n=1 Tax=Corynebacterium riegelii TaxID=156976 RepID=UPI0023F3D89E|nr:helix-turn-helix domain-containing protein [Corynebacterium riegelii]
MNTTQYRDSNSEEFDFEELFTDPDITEAAEDAETRMRLADALRAGRKQAGMSQRDVAEAMGTTQSAISDLERGETDPQLSTLQRYARATGAHLKVFLSFAQATPANTATQHNQQA